MINDLFDNLLQWESIPFPTIFLFECTFSFGIHKFPFSIHRGFKNLSFWPNHLHVIDLADMHFRDESIKRCTNAYQRWRVRFQSMCSGSWTSHRCRNWIYLTNNSIRRSFRVDQWYSRIETDLDRVFCHQKKIDINWVNTVKSGSNPRTVKLLLFRITDTDRSRLIG